MKLINKTSFSIVNKTSSVSYKKHALILESQEAEILAAREPLEIDEEGNQLYYPLNFIASLTIDESEFPSTVTYVNFVNDNEKEFLILAYDNSIIDCTFCKKNYKVTSSLPAFFKKFSAAYIICKENPHVIDESTRTSEDTMKSTACMDNISADMRVIIQANPTLIQLETNPTRIEAVEIAEAKCRAEVLIFIEEDYGKYQAILDISELDTI